MTHDFLIGYSDLRELMKTVVANNSRVYMMSLMLTIPDRPCATIKHVLRVTSRIGDELHYWQLATANYLSVFADMEREQSTDRSETARKIVLDFLSSYEIEPVSASISFPKDAVLLDGRPSIMTYDKATNNFVPL